MILKHSLQTCKLPQGTALAMTNPLYKGGDQTDPANFRPIALTNHLTKIFKQFLKSELATFLDSNNLMKSTLSSNAKDKLSKSTIYSLSQLRSSLVFHKVLF